MADGDCPHVLFYGPSGAGKKTLVLALLREIYGPGVERIKVESKDWKIEVGERKVEVELTMLSSNYHVEMNPSDVGNKDRYVVQEVIKEMARGRLIGADGAKGFKGASYMYVAALGVAHICAMQCWCSTRLTSSRRRRSTLCDAPWRSTHVRTRSHISMHAVCVSHARLLQLPAAWFLCATTSARCLTR